MESCRQVHGCHGDWVSYVTRSAHSAFDFLNRCKHRYFSPKELVHSLERCETKPKLVFGQMQLKLLPF